MPFEVYKRKPLGRSVSPEPTVSIGKSGNISLNWAAYSLLDNAPKAVQLLYDAKAKKVGVKGVEEGTDDSYKLRGSPSHTTFVVHAKSFLEHYKIGYDEARSFEAQQVEGNIVAFDVK